MADVLTCVVEASAPISVLRMRGELNFATAVDLRAALHKALTTQPHAILVDITEMEIRDEISAMVFPAFARAAANWPGCPVLLCTPDPVVRDTLERMAVDRATPIFRDRAAALGAATATRAPRRVHQRLATSPAAPAIARQMAADACLAWHVPHLIEDAELVVTELVSNAVRHVGGTMELAVTLRDRFLHLSVGDRGVEPPMRGLPDPDTGEGGRGLLLLDAIASGWGSTATPPGKVVWATLRISRSGRERRRPEPRIDNH